VVASKNEINPIFEAAKEIQLTFDNWKWRFCFIGGLAVMRWGEIRFTADVDVCLLCGFGNEEKYLKLLLDKFKPRIKDAFQFALHNRVVLINSSNDIPIDISLSGIEFEDQMINRASPFLFYPECELITCSAEDLIILKAFADRTKDWHDVETIIQRQGKKLDKNYIFNNLRPLILAKGNLNIEEELKVLFKKVQ